MDYKEGDPPEVDDVEMPLPPATTSLGKPLFLVTGNRPDPQNTGLTLHNFYWNATQVFHTFIDWLNKTDDGLATTDDAQIRIEVAPYTGRICVGNQKIQDNLTDFINVMENDDRKELSVLARAGGITDFDTFARSVAQLDDDFDINFHTTIRYMVARTT